MRAAQGLIAEEPRLALAGPTMGWVAAAADATEAFLQPGALAHIRIPVLVATAAEEQLVDNASHAHGRRPVAGRARTSTSPAPSMRS